MSVKEIDFENFLEYRNDLTKILTKYTKYPGMKTIASLIYLLQNYGEEQNLKNMDIIEKIGMYSKTCIQNEELETKFLLLQDK